MLCSIFRERAWPFSIKEGNMNLLKTMAVLSIVALPFLLNRDEGKDLSQDGREVDTDEIFDLELT